MTESGGFTLWSAKRLLLATSALAISAMPASAFAQTAAAAAAQEDQEPEAPTGGAEAGVDADNPNTIVVTGIRRALETARNIKRNSDTFVDSITASDVATLPDLSVAEALGRVPGVSVSRYPEGGASPDFPSPEGRGNLVRGLGYVRSEFNGRDAFTANAGRALDWSSIPPELVGAVDVFKNQTADLIEGGISGTINLRTLEPFDRKDRFAAAALDFTYSDLRKKWSPQGSLTLGDRWDTGIGEVGAIVSYSKSKLASRIHGWQQGAPTPRRLGPNGTVPAFGGGTGPERLNEVVGVNPSQIIGTTAGFQLRTNDVDRDRTSYYTALQWQTDRVKLTGKFVRSRTDIDSIERTWERWTDRNPGRNEIITDLTLDSDWGTAGTPFCNGEGGFPSNPGDCETLIPIAGGLMESGLVTSVEDTWTGIAGANVASLGIGRKEKAITQDISLNAQWEVTDRLTANFDAHKTRASAKMRQLWIGLNSWHSYRINHDLEDPRIEFYPVPGNVFNPNFTRFTGDDGPNGTPIPSATSAADPNGYNLQYASDIYQKGSGDLYAIRGDFNYELGDGGSWFDAVKFGARYAVRDQINNEAGDNWGGIAPAWGGRGGYGIVGTFQDQSITEAVDFSNFFRGGVVQGDNSQFRFVNDRYLNDYSAFADYIANEPQLAAGLSFWSPRLENDGSAWGGMNFLPQHVSDITEKARNAYVRLDFGNEFGDGMSIDGNIGVRYVRTDLNSSGFRSFNDFDADIVEPIFVNGVRRRTDDAESRDSPRDFLPQTAAYLDQAAVPVDFKIKDTHWLPSFNAKLNINPEMLFRVGVSKGLARPDVQNLRAAQEYSVTTTRTNPVPITDPTNPLFGVDRGALNITPGQIRVSRGNPLLKPTTAWNYDLSYEYYFGSSNYLSVSAFLKKLRNIVGNGEMGLGTETLDGVEVPIVYSGLINQSKANVKGVEIAYQQFYDFLPGILSNLGTQANYTFVKANATPPNVGVDANLDGVPDGGSTVVYRWGIDDMLGQSKHLANAVGIYQDDKLELRLAYNWRSKYLVTYRDYVTGMPIWVQAGGVLDASAKYQITPQLQLRASVANLLDTKSKARGQIDQAGTMYDRFSFLNDRRFVLGALAQF